MKKLGCSWKREVYDYLGPVEYAHWKTGCGRTYNPNQNGSEKHGFKFCPYCGGKIGK